MKPQWLCTDQKKAEQKNGDDDKGEAPELSDDKKEEPKLLDNGDTGVQDEEDNEEVDTGEASVW